MSYQQLACLSPPSTPAQCPAPETHTCQPNLPTLTEPHRVSRPPTHAHSHLNSYTRAVTYSSHMCRTPAHSTQLTHTLMGISHANTHTHKCTHLTDFYACTCTPSQHPLIPPPSLLPVVGAVDRHLAGEAQHPTHHPAVVHGPAVVTHLPPVALVLHLHGTLGHWNAPLGTSKDGLEPYLLQPPALQGTVTMGPRVPALPLSSFKLSLRKVGGRVVGVRDRAQTIHLGSSLDRPRNREGRGTLGKPHVE